MNYSWIILKHVDQTQRTVLQPIKSKNSFKGIQLQSYQENINIVYFLQCSQSHCISYIVCSNLGSQNNLSTIVKRSDYDQSHTFNKTHYSYVVYVGMSYNICFHNHIKVQLTRCMEFKAISATWVFCGLIQLKID
jgi:hypothetical protein